MRKKTPPARRRKTPSTAGGVEAVRKLVVRYQRKNDERFRDGEVRMAQLATRDDVTKVMVDQASKSDLAHLTKLLLNEDGEPNFVTKEDIAPVISIYNGGVFLRNLVIGTGAVMLALAAIGGSAVWLIQYIRHG